MATIETSSLSGAVQEGLFDELLKIAEDGEKKPGKFKKWLKSSLLIAGGTGAGTAAAMAADKFLTPRLGPKFQSLSPATRKLILGSASGLALAGSYLAGRKILEERHKREDE